MKRVLYLFISFISALAFVAAPLRAVAEGTGLVVAAQTVPPVIITEIQTGAATASDEFIELYNRSSETVDITGWQIRYINSTVTTGATTLLATITPASGSSVLLESGKYFVLHTQSVSLPSGDGQVFTASLSKTDKTVALFARDETVCQLLVQDAIAWEATPGTTVGESAGVGVSAANANKDKLLQRYRDSAGGYIDTDQNALDISLSTVFTGATPASDNTQLLAAPPTGTGTPSPLANLEAPDCTLPDPDPEPEPEPPATPPVESPPAVIQPPDPAPNEPPAPRIPTENTGLKAPQLSELLPNPGTPKTDANDEFIELYNPNDAPFTLNGYVLETGLSSKRRYTFPTGTVLPAKSFKAFFAADTGLTLSNTSSQARLVDPLGKVLVQSDVYATAKDDHVWLLANGSWQWSVTPTPNALNVVKSPEAPAKKTTTSKKSTAKNNTTAKSNPTNADQKEQQDDQVLAAATTNTGTPLHPGVLALVGGFALLYGAYEYRHDVANKIRKFRRDRALSRAAR